MTAVLLMIVLLVIPPAYGQAWDQLNSIPTSNALGGISFVDARHGWVVAPAGIIVHTTNGGNTWVAQASGTSANLKSVDFVDSLYGWAVGGTPFPNESGLVLHTTDGGMSWANQNLQSTNFFWDVAFTSRQAGWISRGTGYYHTTDGGSTWASQATGVSYLLYGVSFPDSLHGWGVGYNGTVVQTANGGLSWAAQNGGTTNSLQGVAFVDAQNGWAVGGWPGPGLILHTTNGGATWVTQNSGSNDWFYSVAFVNTQLGWAVGRNGTIVHTTDGGQTWVGQASGTTNHLLSVTFLDERHGWIVGEQGTFLRYRWTVPDHIIGVTATEDRCDSVLVSWCDVQNDTIYHVFRDGFEVGTTPHDTTHFWDHPEPGTHAYQVRAENPVGLGTLSDSVPGQIHSLIAAADESFPDTAYAGQPVVLHLAHCNGVVRDSVFIILDGQPGIFLSTFFPVADTCAVILPDTMHSEHYNCLIRITSVRGERRDTLMLGTFIIEPVNAAEPLPSGWPWSYYLAPAFPNPFNPSTNLRFGVPTRSYVSVDVYDLLGRKMQMLYSGMLPQGEHEVQWNCPACPSGMYVVRMQAGAQTLQQKMLLLK